MIIVIDGYNVLKQNVSSTNITKKERANFGAILSKYSRRKKHQIVLIFDGGPYQWVYKETIGGVVVVYSGERKTADDVIKRYLEENHRRNLLLVSSDRELNIFASNLNVASIDSYDFYKLLQDGVQAQLAEKEARGGRVVKLTESDNPQLDALMEQAVHSVPTKQEDVLIHEPVVDKRKLAKKDRILLKKLKKL